MNKDSAMETRNKIKKELRKKRKKKLREEYSELIEVQNILKMRIGKVEEAIATLRSDEIIALKKEDKKNADLIESMIKQYELEYERMMKRYKMNSEILKLYSEVLKNGHEGRAAVGNLLIGSAGVAASTALAAIGLKKAYASDIEGTMRNAKTFDWIKSLPIIRNFGSSKKL